MASGPPADVIYVHLSSSEPYFTPHFSHVPYQVSSTRADDSALTMRKNKSTKKRRESDDYGVLTDDEYLSLTPFTRFVFSDEKEKDSVFRRGDM